MFTFQRQKRSKVCYCFEVHLTYSRTCSNSLKFCKILRNKKQNRNADGRLLSRPILTAVLQRSAIQTRVRHFKDAETSNSPVKIKQANFKYKKKVRLLLVSVNWTAFVIVSSSLSKNLCQERQKTNMVMLGKSKEQKPTLKDKISSVKITLYKTRGGVLRQNRVLL